jgi:hypothetical protein
MPRRLRAIQSRVMRDRWNPGASGEAAITDVITLAARFASSVLTLAASVGAVVFAVDRSPVPGNEAPAAWTIRPAHAAATIPDLEQPPTRTLVVSPDAALAVSIAEGMLRGLKQDESVVVVVTEPETHYAIIRALDEHSFAEPELRQPLRIIDASFGR